jgi:outer membrane protein TolC
MTSTKTPFIALSTVCLATSVATAHAESLSFVDAVNTMVNASPKFRAAQEAIKADMAATRPGLYAHYPEVSANAGTGLSGAFAEEARTSRNASLGASLSVPLYRFGADEARRNLATLTLGQAEPNERALRTESEKEAAALLFDCIKAVQTSTFEENILRSRDDLLRKTEALFQKGLLPAEELSKLQYEIGVAKLAARESASRAKELQTQVASMLPADTAPPTLEWPWSLTFFEGVEKNWSERLRAEWAAAAEPERIALQKSALELEASRAGQLPSIGFGASASKNFDLTPRDENRPAQGSNSNPVTWSLGLSTSIPLFPRVAESSRVEAAARGESAARLRLQERERQIALQAESLKTSLRNALDAARERQGFLQQAEKNLTRSRERFLAGKISANDLTMDETARLQMEMALGETMSTLHTNVVSLCAAATVPLTHCVERLAP